MRRFKISLCILELSKWVGGKRMQEREKKSRQKGERREGERRKGGNALKIPFMCKTTRIRPLVLDLAY